ncbi:MAG: PQQ-dependent sugar dehydrogenase [Hyphomonadaceae bacterium]|nr:PQQ-dependent sugar dehydrogenase [Hyphomonadaceae bacterium]
MKKAEDNNRMRNVLFATLLGIAACTGAESHGQPGGAVTQGAPNANFTPAFAGQTRAPERPSGVTLQREVLASGLTRPWAIAFLPDGRALVTERPGRLRVVSAEGVVSPPVAGLPSVDARGQGGLLDIALSPTFAQDRLIYWSYAEPRGGETNATSVARGRLSEDGSRVEGVQVIFRQRPAWRSTGHFGSRLVFDPEGRLYITLGDRQQTDSRERAQDLSSHIGKVIRINADGGVPDDNPFVNREDAQPEIWSYGHRNVQSADIHPQTGALWTVEHGPRGGDELNLTQAGLNYGWPVISYGLEYSRAPVNEGIAVREGMEQPNYYWDPVIAPGGMVFYRGDLFPWRGDLLISGLNTRALVRLVLEGERVVGEERFDIGARVRDVAQSADGALWVVTDDENGAVLRLTPQH